jgi:hypothetical protein
MAADLEQLTAQVMTTLMNRRGYANGAKPKKVDTPAGTLTLDGSNVSNTSARANMSAVPAGALAAL